MVDINEIVESTVDVMERYLAKCSVELNPDEVDLLQDTLQEILERRLEM